MKTNLIIKNIASYFLLVLFHQSFLFLLSPLILFHWLSLFDSLDDYFSFAVFIKFDEPVLFFFYLRLHFQWVEACAFHWFAKLWKTVTCVDKIILLWLFYLLGLVAALLLIFLSILLLPLPHRSLAKFLGCGYFCMEQAFLLVMY